MIFTRRTFLEQAALGLGALVGPWSLAGRKGFAATRDTPALDFLTPSEYRYINRLAREIIPDEPILKGTVDVAGNIDRFFAQTNTAPDFLIMLRFVRLVRLADPLYPILKAVSPMTAEDIISFKRTICFLGYYSDANGEADLPPEKRVVWPRLGYEGPKGDDWWPPDKEVQLDRSLLKDRVQEEGA